MLWHDIHTCTYIQYNTIQYNTIQYNTIQYNTIQYICRRTHACTSVHTYIHTYIHTSIHPSIHPSIHACMHACMHACIRTYIHACIHHTHASLHTYIHAYIHTYIHTYMAVDLNCFIPECPSSRKNNFKKTNAELSRRHKQITFAGKKLTFAKATQDFRAGIFSYAVVVSYELCHKEL